MLLERFTSADQIRRFFQLAGITGTPGDARSCPIANYVRPFFPHARYIRVTRYDVFVIYGTGEHRTGRNAIGNRCQVTNPDPYAPVMYTTSAMESFVRRFDDGMYPELIA